MMRRMLLAACALLAATAANARTQALLFGVGEYPGLPPGKHLNAPVNDVQRFAGALQARGVSRADIRVLADNVSDSVALPTRAAILSELETLAAQASKGDLIIIYGTGHGSRQAARPGKKADGLDQLFLPRDTQMQGAAFQNAIVGYEFGERLDAIRRTGADVWFILDSCFSGSASRAVGEGVRDKMVDPADVGVSVAATLTPDESLPLAESPPLPQGAGRLVAFYASQPNETAREVALPPNVPIEKRAWGSIFTLALARAMERADGLTYRQLMIETGRLLRADPALLARQTPSFEGDGLELSLVGSTREAASASWRVADGLLAAGKLEGVEEGAIFALYDGVGDDAKPLANAIVAEADSLRSRLVPLRAGCDPLKAECARNERGALPPKATYARLLKPARGAVLKISAPRARPGAPAADADRQAAVLASVRRVIEGPLKGRAMLDEGSPDMVAWIDSDNVRFMPNGGDPGRAEYGPSVAHGNLDAEALDTGIARALLRARQVITLQRLEAAAAGRGARGARTEIEARRFSFDASRRQCAFTGAKGEAVAEGQPVAVCDKIIVTIENSGRQTIAPAVFFLDDSWNIIPRRPSCPVGLTVADRLEPGRRLTFEVPYNPRAVRPGLAPSTSNGVFVAAIPFVEGETAFPNLCALTAFNDAAGRNTRSMLDEDDLDQIVAGSSRNGARLPLESGALSLSFWPVTIPLRQ
ncbi:MAG: caspase family protein [Beijerinckiaceae bacterium]|nr:caspase family protein [Beijerinckiaceae bacterium]